MKTEFHLGNRKRLYDMLPAGSLLVLFSGNQIIKTNDEYYPFFADRSFVYLTGLECKEAVLLAAKDAEGSTKEIIYILPPDFLAERWTGTRIRPAEAMAVTGATDIRRVDQFRTDFEKLAVSSNYGMLYLDLFKIHGYEIDRPAHGFERMAKHNHPYLKIGNANALIRKLRLIKQPCEIEALRKAEEITKAGILAMMKASRPGMHEYQYKAEFDRAIGQFHPKGPGFPPIISAGRNNFCIHYYAYAGQAHDGDMVLNDVGGQWDNLIADVSRGWPCNGRYSDKQRLLYECALATSDHMFEIIKPGMRMGDVDAIIRRYNCDRLKDAGVLSSYDQISTYMWHAGAHHIGYDVHDVVEIPETVAPGMVFCIDVGIYHEEWGIGFRIEDNCLITPDGCENISGAIPRRIEDIEDFMN